ATFILISVYLLATRWRQIPTQPNEDPFLSRGTFLVLSTITLLVSTAVIAVGTSAPILTRFMENPGQVGPEFYNRVNLPIALLVALLLAFVPYLTWKGNTLKEVLRKMIVPLGISLVVTIGAAVWQVRDVFHLLFVFLAMLALATNLQKTIDKARNGGLRLAGGYLAHVGVGVILLGILASSAYDHSAKVTLEMGVPKKVDDATLTFTRFIPRQGQEKERMEIEVVRNGERFLVYPKLFMNDRTRQAMANPDIRSTPLQDFYVSPIEFDPGQPRLQLAKGESGRIGDMDIRFDNLDLGNAMAQMAAGQPFTVGAVLAVTRGGQTSTVKPLYRLDPVNGSVETPPTTLPGGGSVFVAGINASNGAVELEVTGANNPPKLSVDVTQKPLIQLVWFGLYIVLLGGALATVSRIRQVKAENANA
ncbi:MAG TPA: cytochrome c-type biogenesis CcmF C-terminal domain-containing protein, partial [Thermoanaerobaculia bacterium]|nr:cytochrome c-type biogenesis CcmF C-terminal domain-containing protein [Thermoanaerobaculia bacterium]